MKKKRKEFNPNSLAIAKATKEYLKSGGKITVIRQEDILGSEVKLYNNHSDSCYRKTLIGDEL